MWQNLDCLLTAKKKTRVLRLNAQFCSQVFLSVKWELDQIKIDCLFTSESFSNYFAFISERTKCDKSEIFLLDFDPCVGTSKNARFQSSARVWINSAWANHQLRFSVSCTYSKVPIISCTLFQFQAKVWLKSVTPFPTKMNDRVKTNGPANAR